MLIKPWFLKRPLSGYHPKLLGLAIKLKTFDRKLDLLFDGHSYSQTRNAKALKYRIKKHKSVLIRKLGDSDMQLQLNKLENLKIVVSKLNGIIIKPGETFSFFKILGKPSKSRGFVEAMLLANGEVVPGIGGGICQSSNLIYWLAIHTPLEIIERHHHSFDPFPDQGRVLPFASGATVMYNYLDLRLKNTGKSTFQLLLGLDQKFLYGEFRSSAKLPISYKVVEKNHFFEKVGVKYFRGNELYRRVIDRKTGNQLREEFIVRNYCELKYEPSKEKLESGSSINSC